MKQSTDSNTLTTIIGWITLLSLAVICLTGTNTLAADTVCAEVKLEIAQELTLERQAFDAHMRINNGLANITLEDVAVDVSFADGEGNAVLATSNPNNEDALFFISVDTMDGIEDVEGEGVVSPSSSADIHWLIIPSPGAADGIEGGTLYYVGATLTYSIGGEPHTMEVTPDHIRVKPMPDVLLEYFLPEEVFGDDAFTSGIVEPSVPFALGIRASNQGAGTVNGLKIESAQPKIVDNEQGLLVGFSIEESRVNGQPSEDTLLVDLGDIAPGKTSVARWVMSCTLSGNFTAFEAELFHADELGGALTSLIQDPVTHTLVRDVLVDFAGRDGIHDFLTLDDSVYRIYESEGGDAEVTDHSGTAQLQYQGLVAAGEKYALTLPETSGFVFVKLNDPYSGEKTTISAIRSDGKTIKPENIWFSKSRNGTDWDYHICLFDGQPSTTYALFFATSEGEGTVPEFVDVSDQTAVADILFSLTVGIKDAGLYSADEMPELTASPLPAGAEFTDHGDGSGLLTWTPAEGQAGSYNIGFEAENNAGQASISVAVTVFSASDSDGDGMADAWEMLHFGTLDRDGTGDFDGDGISDLDEFLAGSDPTVSSAASVPVISAPAAGAEVMALRPELVIVNSVDPDGDEITYDFEIYADEAMTVSVDVMAGVAETSDTTAWTTDADLNDNTLYYWRVRATDGTSYSSWAIGRFFVNTANDPPGPFAISLPDDGAQVDTETPDLEVTNSLDVDLDTVTYTFEVYEDAGLTIPVTAVSNVAEGSEGTTFWTVDTALAEDTWYYWRAVAKDEHGAVTETEVASFYVSTINEAPTPPVVSSPEYGAVVVATALNLSVYNSSDVEGDSLSYWFELDTANTFDSESLLSSGSIAEGTDTTFWGVSGLLDNTEYYWRVKADDGAAESSWTTASFFVNTANDPPSAPTLKNPGSGAWVGSLTPLLEINPSIDPDGDSLTYQFELYADSALTILTEEDEIPVTEWTVPSTLADNARYYWRARAVDTEGEAGPWMSVASFFTDSNGVDDTPSITITEPSGGLTVCQDTIVISWTDTDADSNAEIFLYYDSDNTGEDGTLIVSGLYEDSDDEDDAYSWDISGLSGTYYLYAVIDDGTTSQTAYSTGMIIIDCTAPAVTASPAGGEYTSEQNVVLTAGESADIYYTTDGTDPVAGTSPLYESPIVISQTTTLKFIAVDAAGNQSAVVVEDYVISTQEVQGDLDDDGDIDSDDYMVFRSTLGKCDGDPEFLSKVDYDGDGCVTLADCRVWYGYYRGQ